MDLKIVWRMFFCENELGWKFWCWMHGSDPFLFCSILLWSMLNQATNQVAWSTYTTIRPTEQNIQKDWRAGSTCNTHNYVIDQLFRS